jgi:Domain of unknown function (DUF3850)
MVHELKTPPEYFEAVMGRKKTFELRRNDRDFKVDDILILKEWKPDTFGKYTGRTITALVIYALYGDNSIANGFGLKEDHCLMSLKLLKIDFSYKD